MCELCLFTVDVERYRRESRAEAVESFWEISPRTNSTLDFLFLFRFFFCSLFDLLFFTQKVKSVPLFRFLSSGPALRTQPAVFYEKATKKKVVNFLLFFSSSGPPLIP